MCLNKDFNRDIFGQQIFLFYLFIVHVWGNLNKTPAHLKDKSIILWLLILFLSIVNKILGNKAGFCPEFYAERILTGHIQSCKSSTVSLICKYYCYLVTGEKKKNSSFNLSFEAELECARYILIKLNKCKI